MRHQVVICTKDRPREVDRVLDALFDQTCQPLSIDVIDSSTAKACEQIVMAARVKTRTTLRYVRSRPGLTRQRNVALAALDEHVEVVHFLDDDVIPEPEYLEHMASAFEGPENSDVVGACGRITNLPAHRPTRVHEFFGIDSRRDGALLRSGVNVLPFHGREPLRVDWLSGCSMSYRVSALGELWFDESRTGNGLGEDVDFSARVAARGRLLLVPGARVEHRQSPINRDDADLVRRKAVVHRWWLSLDRVGNVRRRWVLLATLAEMALHLVKATWHRSRTQAGAARALLLGLGDAFRLPRPARTPRERTWASSRVSPDLVADSPQVAGSEVAGSQVTGEGSRPAMRSVGLPEGSRFQ